MQEYAVDLNATRAAVRAGYAPASARQQGSDLMSRPAIAEAIAVELQARATRVGVTAEKVLKELAYVAFSDILNVIESAHGEEMVLRDLKTLPDAARRTIESIQVKSLPGGGVSRTVKLHSKTTALKMLLDHLGLSAPIKIAPTNTAGEDLSGASMADLLAVAGIKGG